MSETAATAVCPGCKDVALLAEKIKICKSCEGVYHESCWARQGSKCVKEGCLVETPTGSAPEVADEVPEGPVSLVRGILPLRVQSGQFGEEGLRIQTGGGERHIPWASMSLMLVAIIELDLTVEMPRSAMRAMLRKLMGDEGQPNHQRRSIRETYLLDIYLKDQDAPLRIDSSVVNYRSLLGEVSHQSQKNFVHLMQRMIKSTPDCLLDSSAVALLAGKRYALKRYSSIYEFEMESHMSRNKPEQHTLAKDLKLPEDVPLAMSDWED